MDLDRLRAFAEDRLEAFGLAERGWVFRFDRAKRRFGSCRYRTKEITVSRHLAHLNSEAEGQDTVLHEIAHALAGREAGHGPAWRAACRRVGARPERCYGAGSVRQPPPSYWGVCPACAGRMPYYRRPRTPRACGPCCRDHNGGRYDERFRLEVVANPAASASAL